MLDARAPQLAPRHRLVAPMLDAAPEPPTSSGPPAPAPLVPTTVLPTALRRLFPYPHLNAMQSECFEVAFRSDASLIVASPTGSGKTGVLELALARLWATGVSRALAIYVAPLKALVTERLNDWEAKTRELGVRVVALTGDEDDETADERSVAAADLILTTPEKWDSFTRFRRDAQGLIGRVSLLLLDEIHLLNDEQRGPTLESMVSRMQTISGSIKEQGHALPIAQAATPSHACCHINPRQAHTSSPPLLAYTTPWVPPLPLAAAHHWRLGNHPERARHLAVAFVRRRRRVRDPPLRRELPAGAAAVDRPDVPASGRSFPLRRPAVPAAVRRHPAAQQWPALARLLQLDQDG